MLLLLLIVARCTQVGLALWNSALFKPAFQSSDFMKENKAMTAVDGKDDYDMVAGDVCTHTNSDEPAWWMVDLQGLYSIKQVVLTNRKSLSSKRLRNFRIEVFLNDPRDGSVKVNRQICATQGSSSLPSGHNELTCAPGIKGRYVRVIWMEGYREVLTICEAKILVDSVHAMYQTYDVTKNVKFTANPLLILHTPDVLTCSMECNNRRDKELCMAFNWNSELRECRLLSVKPQDSIDQIPDPAWALYGMTPYE